MIFLFLLTVIYIFTKYILSWISYQYRTKCKWRAVLVLGSLYEVHKIIMKQKSETNHDVIHKYNQYQKLSDDELEYIMYNGSNTERRSARLILEERIKNQVKQHNEHSMDTSRNSKIVLK